MTIPFECGSRSRCAREGGWLGRRRTYRCRQCGQKFKVDTPHALPEGARLCSTCRPIGEYPFKFVDKTTGKKQVVFAGDAELATLRAWKINPNLTFDVSPIRR